MVRYVYVVGKNTPNKFKLIQNIAGEETAEAERYSLINGTPSETGYMSFPFSIGMHEGATCIVIMDQ